MRFILWNRSESFRLVSSVDGLVTRAGETVRKEKKLEESEGSEGERKVK